MILFLVAAPLFDRPPMVPPFVAKLKLLLRIRTPLSTDRKPATGRHRTGDSTDATSKTINVSKAQDGRTGFYPPEATPSPRQMVRSPRHFLKPMK
jgi:hypothetical protein